MVKHIFYKFETANVILWTFNVCILRLHQYFMKSNHVPGLAIISYNFARQGVSKNIAKGKISSTSDIPQNLGYFLQPSVIRCLLVSSRQFCFQTKFLLPGGGGDFYRLILKWFAHKNFKLKMACYLTGFKYQSFTKNGLIKSNA